MCSRLPCLAIGASLFENILIVIIDKLKINERVQLMGQELGQELVQELGQEQGQKAQKQRRKKLGSLYQRNERERTQETQNQKKRS